MDDVLGYEGKHVVVTGAASGMGEQVARILHELGANVTALDLGERLGDWIEVMKGNLALPADQRASILPPWGKRDEI